MVKELIIYCRLEQVGHEKMWSLIALFLESAKFRCSFIHSGDQMSGRHTNVCQVRITRTSKFINDI